MKWNRANMFAHQPNAINNGHLSNDNYTHTTSQNLVTSTCSTEEDHAVTQTSQFDQVIARVRAAVSVATTAWSSMCRHLRTLPALLFACLSLTILAAPTPAHAQSSSVSMGWEDWRPYQFRDDTGAIKGLDVEIVSNAFAVMNRKLDLVELPWKRHLLNIESGRTDLAASASRTPEREVYAYYSAPYRTESAALFIRNADKEKFRFNSLEEIIGTEFKLAVTRGYYYGEEFSRLMEDERFRSHVREVNDNQLAQRQLARGRVDGFLEDPIAAKQELETEGLLDQTYQLLTVYSDDIFVMFSKKTMTEDDVAAFNDALQQLRDDGTYATILDRYLPPQNN